MAFITTNRHFENVFMTSEPNQEEASRFFEQVMDYLSDRIVLKEAKALYEWIEDERPVQGFTCRIDLVRNIADKFIVEHIPFLCVADERGDVGFLIRACDGEKTDDVKRDVLEEKAKYVRVVSSEELKKDLMFQKDSDKNILYISGLTEEQTEVLEEMCDAQLDGEEIGIDEMQDGTYTFSFHGKKAFYRSSRSTLSVNQILALMIMRTEGFHAEKNNLVARNRLEFNRIMADGFRQDGSNGRNTSAWIVGSGKHYMKIDENGFEYGHAVTNEDGLTELEEQYSIDASTPDYRQQLNSYLARIDDKAVTFDMRQAFRHLEGKDVGLSFWQSKDERKVALFEAELIKKTSEFVLGKIRTDPIMKMDGRWDEKLNLYLREMASVIDAVKLNEPHKDDKDQVADKEDRGKENKEEKKPEEVEIHTVPEGYKKEQIKELYEIGHQKEISLEAYDLSIRKLRHMEIAQAPASLKRVKDVDKKLEEMGRRSQGIERREEPSRGGRGGIAKEMISHDSSGGRATAKEGGFDIDK